MILLKKKSDSPELRAIITRFCASLVSQAARLQDGTLAYAIGAVDTLLPHLNPAEVSEIREKITSRALQALGDNSCMPFAMGMISTDLVSIVSSMSPEEKARICSEAAGSILKKIRVASRKDQERLGRPLLTLLALIPSKDAMAIVTDGIQSTNNSSVVHLLSETLSNLARRAESGEASQACSPIVELCKQRMKRSTDRAIRDMCLAITALAPHMDQGQAVRLCRAYANGLTNALAKYPQPLARRRLAEAVSQLATRIPTVDAEQICSRGSMTLLRAIQSIHDAKSLHLHLQGLSNLVLRVKPRDAQRICSQASTRLLQVLKIEKKSNSIKELIDALRVIAPHLEALNAVPVAAAFTKALKSGRNSSSARSGLFVITERLPKKEAEEVALTLMDEFIKPSASIGYLRIPLEVVRPLSPDNLFRKVVLFIEGMSQTKRFDRFIATFTLLLTDARHSQITSRARSMASLLAKPQSASNFLMIKRYLKPLSCRLTTQQLVDLLKMPTCIRDPKRIILSQLENRFGEKFHNHWDFVRYAKEKNLDLNFNSPPGKLATLETRP